MKDHYNINTSKANLFNDFFLLMFVFPGLQPSQPMPQALWHVNQ